MKTPKNMKRLAAVPFVASTGLLTLLAVPAAAAPPNPFDLPEQCNYFSEPTNILACFSQSGQISQTNTPGGNTITRANVITTSAVYEGPTKEGTQIAQSKTTQLSKSVTKNGQPVVFGLRQLIDADNFATGLSCTFNIQLVITGDKVRHGRNDVNCE